MQDKRDSIANKLELRLSCTNPFIWRQIAFTHKALKTHPHKQSVPNNAHLRDILCMDEVYLNNTAHQTINFVL